MTHRKLKQRGLPVRGQEILIEPLLHFLFQLVHVIFVLLLLLLQALLVFTFEFLQHG